jgi:hypothetical protein
MTGSEIIRAFTDPYEKKARLFPGLLVALPLIVPTLLIVGSKTTYLTAIVGLIASCGALYWLASITRNRGKALEEKLIAKWGGLPTTLILRHRDSFLDNTSKARFHSEIKTKLGIELPSIFDESANPLAADDLYIGASRQLRELTRGDSNALLLKENIAYGFHRNMLAMRPIGLTTCLLGAFFGLVRSNAIQLKTMTLDLSKLADPSMVGGISLTLSLVLIFAWLSTNEMSVRRMGNVYAERLFESLKSLPTKRKRVEVES